MSCIAWPNELQGVSVSDYILLITLLKIYVTRH